jgi:predicted O-methyltransferase YrrM
MKFEQVYGILLNHQKAISSRVVLLAEATLREIYDCVIATRSRDCLELGTGHGATTCVIAAALEEIGGGTITTIDHRPDRKHNISELAQVTGMQRYVRAIVHPAGYNWTLMGILREQTAAGRCEPCVDFCYLNGAHEWVTDALAALLALRLLRPGGWLMIDDLNFRLRGCNPGWEKDFGHKTNEELDTPQIGMVFDLLVKTHPDLERLALTNTGHIGWARRKGGGPALWLPNGVTVGPIMISMQQSYDGLPLDPNAPTREGVILEKQERGTLIHATVVDPWVVFSNPVQPASAIDSLTLRLRLLAPEMETVQLYWIPSDEADFREEHCQRCIVRASSEPQDLTFAFTGNERERTMLMFRLDPGENPCTMLVESVTFGRW